MFPLKYKSFLIIKWKIVENQQIDRYNDDTVIILFDIMPENIVQKSCFENFLHGYPAGLRQGALKKNMIQIFGHKCRLHILPKLS